MKNTFFEHNMHRLGHVETIKEDSIIILDTNALLNLYRYSEKNRNKFLEILDKVQSRLFLTNQSVDEFYRNRINILKDKSKFKNSLKSLVTNDLKNIENYIKNSNFKGENSSACQLLQYEEDLKGQIIKIINNSINEIDNIIDNHENNIEEDFLRVDPLLDKITDLFDNKVNLKFEEEKLNEIYKHGNERYKKEIPPGYEDLKKNKKPEPECYGDLVIWYEMIEISKTKEANILFISDDTKKDWCEKVSGKNLGPRKELIREFYKATNKLFYSFTTSDFIKYMSKLYNIDNTQDLEKESDTIRASLEFISKSNSAVVATSVLSSVADQYRDTLEAMKVPNLDDYHKSLVKTSGLASIADQYRDTLEAMKVPNLDDYHRSLVKTSGLASIADQYRDTLEVMKVPNLDDYHRSLVKTSGLASIADQYRDTLEVIKATNQDDCHTDKLKLTETSSMCEPDNK